MRSKDINRIWSRSGSGEAGGGREGGVRQAGRVPLPVSNESSPL